MLLTLELHDEQLKAVNGVVCEDPAEHGRSEPLTTSTPGRAVLGSLWLLSHKPTKTADCVTF